MFDPKTNKFPYPTDTGCHYLGVKKDNGLVFDTNYPYLDKTRSFRIKQFLFRIAVVLIAFPIQALRMGFRVKGRKVLRQNRQVIKNGVVSVSNHVHMWDYIGIMNAVFPYKTNILVWDKNISGENGKMIRLVGGIPVPNNDIKALSKMSTSCRKLIENGGWLHVSGEGSMWEYYAPIRPFKEGAAYFAYKTNRPLIPIAYSFRKCWGLRKLFNQVAKLTLSIGDPIYPDMNLSKDEAVDKLTIEAHKAICKMAGFAEGENIYPPIYSEETSKRIDYYTNEYGVGYKGSH